MTGTRIAMKRCIAMKRIAPVPLRPLPNRLRNLFPAARRILTALAACSLAASVSVSCTVSLTEESFAGGPARSSGQARVKLNVIYMDQAGYQPEQFEQMTREFTQLTGIDAALNIVRYDEQYEKIVTSATSPVATYDVVLLDLIWVAEFAEKGYVVPLDRNLAERLRRDISPTILSAFEYGGRIWAMPFLANLHFLFYNKDMLQKAGFSGPPTSFWPRTCSYRGRLRSHQTGRSSVAS